ncbi:unnamed protein product [Porites lobata]|uniref:Uncharacterized protein n=1 Tax=Porites lobata TaxID=104759 RepID=A0ABN8P5V8_9CNID|nr:unnamed protein product [Porites lobata]
MWDNFLALLDKDLNEEENISGSTSSIGVFNMSSLITAVFKATIGLLVNKGRDKLAEKLNEGDVTDQKFRGLIVREIDEIKSKLDGLARKDLKTSISHFKEGIELLYEVFESARGSSEHKTVTEQPASVEAFPLAREMRKLELTSMDERATRLLSTAKERFKEARREATKAFNNEALELPDRLSAMQYRLMATILETVDNPKDCLRPCKVCIEDLHDLSGVKECFKVELKKGFWARLGKDERRKIISTVCFFNRVVYDVTLMTRFGSKDELSENWPSVNTGEEQVYPLRNKKVDEVLKNQGMEHCCVKPWSFGQEGEEEHKLKDPLGIATNHRGQFLIGDNGDKTVKVFDSNGKFDFRFNPQPDDGDTKLDILDVATAGEDDMIYLLVGLEKPGAEGWEREVQVFNKTGDLQHKFPVRRGGWRLTVTSGKKRGKILPLTDYDVVDVHESSGEFVCSFGGGVFKRATDITATCDGRVMIVDWGDDSLYIFDVEGHQLGKFNIKHERDDYYRIACHPARDLVVLAGYERETRRQTLAIYTVNGEFVRRIQLDVVRSVRGITVTVEGDIAVALQDITDKDIHKGKVIVV